MIDPTAQFEARLAKLEQDYAARQSANTLPLTLDQALSGRGFLKKTDIIVGKGSIGFSGFAYLAVPGIKVGNFAIATLSDGSGALGATVTTALGGIGLYVEGIATQVFDFIVFLKTDVTKLDLR